jgi:exonuclease 1
MILRVPHPKFKKWLDSKKWTTNRKIHSAIFIASSIHHRKTLPVVVFVSPSVTMGVTGDLLNRVLKTASRDIDLRHYSRGIEDYSTNETRPLRVGVDVSGWIARATHGHGSMLVDERHLTNFGQAQMRMADQDPFELTTAQNRNKYVQVCGKYVLDRILALQTTTKAQLLVVFDGKSPPLKLNETIRRFAKKKAAVEQRDMQGGDNLARLKAARRTGAGSSHAAIIEELMINLRVQKIAFLVSPYEADGQLAFLSEFGMVDLVLTEDSDLIAHGVRSILYKEDGGRGKLIQRRDLGAMELVPKSLSLMDFSDCMLAVLFACVGCDYCNSLKMIGSVTAREIVVTAFHSSKQDTRPPLAKVFEMLYSRTNQTFTADEKEDYEYSFLAALLMFRHPVIFDPLKAKCVLLRDPPFGSDLELMEYEPYRYLCHNQQKQEEILGELFPTELQSMIAEGYVDPRTMRPYPHTSTPTEMYKAWEVWNASHESPPRKRQKSTFQQDAQLPHQEAAVQQQENTVMLEEEIEIDEGNGPDTQAQDVLLNTETDDMDGPETEVGDSKFQDASETQADDAQYPETQGPETQFDDSQYPETQGPETQDTDQLKPEAPPMEQPSQASSQPASTQESRRSTTQHQEGVEVIDDDATPQWHSPQSFRRSSRTGEFPLRGATPQGAIDLTNDLTNYVVYSPPAAGVNLTGSSSDNPATQSSHPSRESQLSADMMSPPLLGIPTPK